jgi:hypothetical protein
MAKKKEKAGCPAEACFCQLVAQLEERSLSGGLAIDADGVTEDQMGGLVSAVRWALELQDANGEIHRAFERLRAAEKSLLFSDIPLAELVAPYCSACDEVAFVLFKHARALSVCVEMFISGEPLYPKAEASHAH